MNVAEIHGLINRYGKSLYVTFVEQRDIIAGSKVPKPTGDELVRTMEENVRGAERVLKAAKERHERARRDYLFDPDVHALAPDDLAEPLKAASETVNGDLQRAISELAHWAEYVTWARMTGGVFPQREPGEDDE